MDTGPARALGLPLPSEAALDDILLELSCAQSRAAEVFVERSIRYSSSCQLVAGEERWAAPALRADHGIGLRLMMSDEVRAGHLSGADAARAEQLARELVSGDPSGFSSPSPVDEAAAATSQGPATAGLEACLDELAARGKQACKGLGRVALALRLTAAERQIHVVSSEWGHSADTRPWTSLTLELRRFSSDGGARVRRGLGHSGWGIADADDVGRALDEALEASELMLGARPVDPGTPPIVFAAGAGGVLIHEAIGHALEGDVVDRGASVFRGYLGEQVAPLGMTIIDDPTLAGRAGSHAFDDEGSPARPLALIEDGVLRGTLVDVQRAGFSAERCSGHGRRASYRDLPLPRMANTYLAAGTTPDAEVLAGLHSGVLVTQLERGMADPVSGDFRLQVTEGWQVEKGQPVSALRPFTLTGNTRSLLASVEAVGDEVGWDDGCGTCGREDQWLRVSAGQPSLRLAGGMLGVG